MDMGVQVHSGSPSYPGHIAVQRGPQLLVADTSVNPGMDLWISGLRSEEAMGIALGPFAPLPSGWIWAQAYSVKGYTGNELLGKHPVSIVLVPFADGGQLNGEYRTWLQRP